MIRYEIIMNVQMYCISRCLEHAGFKYFTEFKDAGFFMNILAFIHIFHDKFLYEPYYQTPTRHFSFV